MESTNIQTARSVACSVGILTFNSAKTLRRTLDSVKGFSDIIISDGGSTDKTLEIAKEYGCTIIEQIAKNNPGPEPSHPITDFSAEHNQMLKIAKEDWYFRLDSDEYISDELREEVAEVCSKKTPQHFAYRIPIVRQSPDAKINYRDWKQNYQIRFFNLTTGGSFKRKMHEQFVFDTKKYNVGMLKGAWFVPVSKMSFRDYKKAVNYRLRVMMSDTVIDKPGKYFRKSLYLPLKRSVGILYRELIMRLRYPWRELMPLSYMFNRLYSQWVTFKLATKLYFTRSLKQ